jgi:hypothetical protein
VKTSKFMENLPQIGGSPCPPPGAKQKAYKSLWRYVSSNTPDKTDEIVDTCARLERLTPILGSNRVESSEYYIRSQNNVIELVAGECAELVLHPDLASLGATHDFVQADAFAKIAVAAQPAVAALIGYCRAEATALLTENRDILDALVAALVERGTLDGEQVDIIIADTIAARAVEAELTRRADWKHRERNAATFLSPAPSTPPSSPQRRNMRAGSIGLGC